MQLDILTPDSKVYSGEVKAVNLPGTDGSFEVLTGHAALISTLSEGIIKVQTQEGEKNIRIDGGLVEVLNNKVIVLAESVQQ